LDGARVELVGPKASPEAGFQVFLAMFIRDSLRGGRLPEMFPSERT